MTEYLIGIDGGGTSCRAALAKADGTILGRGKSGASNILTDPDTALRHIEEAALLAFSEAGLDADLRRCSALLGLAGNNVGDAVNHVSARLPFGRSDIVSDGLIALEGAIGGGDGAIGIVGTGTIFFARRGDTLRSVAGWGFQVSDLGSGARLGQLALQESLLAYDAMRPMSGFTRHILSGFDDCPDAVVEFARKAKPGDFGRFAPPVFEFAAKGDDNALRIVRAGAAAIDDALDVIAGMTEGQGKLCLLGGLATLYPDYLSARHTGRLSEPLADALTGAVQLAAKRFGGIEPAQVRG
ncbi:MAG: BadF/BadG/BcrA/BcrD ATPase family protein [Neorhizobium sp.]|nr:BadF/BadG/BcrA/BcrD ATPase family protein [Neorhizobium sp.]